MFDRFAETRVLISREFILNNAKTDPGTPVADNQRLKDIVHRLGDLYDARIWVTAGNDVLLKSFQGAIPRVDALKERRCPAARGDVKIYGTLKRRKEIYGVVPLKIPGASDVETGRMHILFGKMEHAGHGAGFGLGLLIIGGVIALLIIPVSRRISRPINNLKHSALKL
ncbi:MAG: hypothetical protein GY859_28655, partial [Desulfobacterales bacterium]|nr:hypothetical protein [Desulfobacterales bacterium]